MAGEKAEQRAEQLGKAVLGGLHSLGSELSIEVKAMGVMEGLGASLEAVR